MIIYLIKNLFSRRSADIDLMTGNLENLLTSKKLMPVVNTRYLFVCISVVSFH